MGTIPLNKIEDFGVHCKQYYSMDVTYFKSALDKSLLDSLWNHYWVNTLSSSSLLTNAEYTTGQISDLADKLETWDNNMGRGAYVMGHDSTDRKAEDKLSKATTDSCKITTEVLNGLMGQVIKDRLFNQASAGCRTDRCTGLLTSPNLTPLQLAPPHLKRIASDDVSNQRVTKSMTTCV